MSHTSKDLGNFGGVKAREKLTEFVNEPAMAGNLPVLCVCFGTQKISSNGKTAPSCPLG